MTEPFSRTDRSWAERPPGEKAWRGRKGRSRQALAAEQNRAAGGADRRWVDLANGCQARASVELKLLPRTRRIRAYLRWSDAGRSPARYLGQVEHESRAENLAAGWRLAWEKGLLAEAAKPAGSWAKTPAVRAAMQGNKSRDTGPERRIRSLLHQAGMRYRVNTRPLPTLRRTADIVFTSVEVAVFVDGCYWHGCSQHYRPSKANQDFWRAKIDANQARDGETDRLLHAAGWTVVRVWEHEVPEAAAERIADVVALARASPSSLGRRRVPGNSPTGRQEGVAP